jgi:hypothetical protein
MKELMSMKKSTLLLVLLLNSACAVREANLRTFDDQRSTTSLERASILAHIKSSFFDPYSIRDAEISHAAPSMMLNGEMTLNICIAANAKNRYGAYAGKQTTLYYLTTSGRVLDTNHDAFAELFCASQRLRYEPFVEAEQLGRISRSQ